MRSGLAVEIIDRGQWSTVRKVGPGGERSARAGEYHHPHGGVGFQARAQILQFVVQGDGQGVEFRRAVQRDGEQAVQFGVPVHLQCFVVTGSIHRGAGHSASLADGRPGCGRPAMGRAICGCGCGQKVDNPLHFVDK